MELSIMSTFLYALSHCRVEHCLASKRIHIVTGTEVDTSKNIPRNGSDMTGCGNFRMRRDDQCFEVYGYR